MRKKSLGKLKVVLSALLVLAIFLPWSASVSIASDTDDDYLRASGSALYDALGNPVRLTGIAWFGFETQNQVYHGLWSVNMEDALDTVADRGFNVLRVPF
jgi:endoglucanase